MEASDMLSRFRPMPAFLALALGVLIAHPALAQLPPPDPARVQDAIDITDRRIQQAKDLLAVTPNAVAAAEVDQAVQLQGIAKQYFAQARYAAAARATFDARVHADRAVALLKGLPDPGRVQDQLVRTREVLDRARHRLAQCDLPAPREMLRTALDMQTRAELAYSETRYLAALQLTMSARERVLRALQLCNAGDSFGDTVEHALQRTDDELARAHELVGADADERSRQLLANADSVQLRAKVEAQAGHPRVALRLTRMAREQAYRAIRGATVTGRR
jgi:hypothetical protein